jgi:NAD(P)H-dependent FMN reductase
MRVLVLSSSLNPGSKSRVMAWEALEGLKGLGVETDFVDLQDFPLPLSGSDRSWDDPNAKVLTERIGKADAILFALPIYTYDANAAAKNLIELSGEGWEGKAVGFICAAGGMGSYMAVMGLANSLMLDFRCLILPRFVYATKEAWDGMAIKDEKIHSRIQDLCKEIVRIGRALKA